MNFLQAVCSYWQTQPPYTEPTANQPTPTSFIVFAWHCLLLSSSIIIPSSLPHSLVFFPASTKTSQQQQRADPSPEQRGAHLSQTINNKQPSNQKVEMGAAESKQGTSGTAAASEGSSKSKLTFPLNTQPLQVTTIYTLRDAYFGKRLVSAFTYDPSQLELDNKQEFLPKAIKVRLPYVIWTPAFKRRETRIMKTASIPYSACRFYQPL